MMISDLPLELQNKIFFYAAEHPCAKMIKQKMLAPFLKHRSMWLPKSDRINLRHCTIHDTDVINTCFIRFNNFMYESELMLHDTHNVDVEHVHAMYSLVSLSSRWNERYQHFLEYLLRSYERFINNSFPRHMFEIRLDISDYYT